jgi:hypothetical protein
MPGQLVRIPDCGIRVDMELPFAVTSTAAPSRRAAPAASPSPRAARSICVAPQCDSGRPSRFVLVGSSESHCLSRPFLFGARSPHYHHGRRRRWSHSRSHSRRSGLRRRARRRRSRGRGRRRAGGGGLAEGGGCQCGSGRGRGGGGQPGEAAAGGGGGGFPSRPPPAAGPGRRGGAAWPPVGPCLTTGQMVGRVGGLTGRIWAAYMIDRWHV